MTVYFFLTMYGLFFLWMIWLWKTEFKDDGVRAVRTLPDAQPAAGTETPSEEAPSEDLQGQRG